MKSEIGNGATFGLLVERSLLPPQLEVASPQTVGRIHFIGDSSALNDCRDLANSWNYQTSSGDWSSVARLPSDTIVICDAKTIPEVAPELSLIVVGPTSDDQLPDQAHALGLPLRPARLRALLRASAVR